MSSSVPIHARNHRPGGVDPLTFPFPRARVWSTYATPVLAITDTHQETYIFDHGITTDEATFEVKFWAGASPPTAQIRILRGGVYGLTYRFNADGAGGAWEDTILAVELFDFTPDYWDHQLAYLHDLSSAASQSYLTTIVNDPVFLPASVYAILRIPTGHPSLTFGSAALQASHPTWNTGSFIEVYRLGDTTTQDWADWWFETPADEAVPAAAGTLLAAEERSLRRPT